MTPTELKFVRRRVLCLSVNGMAENLGVAERTLRRWELGTRPIPDGVAERVRLLEEQAPWNRTDRA